MQIDTITDRHKGETIFVCGTSPNLSNLDFGVLDQGITIGVNQFCNKRKTDYWVTCDPQNIDSRMNGVMNNLHGVTTFIHTHTSVKHHKADYFFDRPPTTKLDSFRQPIGDDYLIPTMWKGYLQHIWTSATAAANLADIMGASEIVLFGVDIKGLTKRGGQMVEWGIMADDIFKFFNRLRCPVYKTSEFSPLQVPLRML